MTNDPIIKAVIAEIKKAGKLEIDFCREYGISQQRFGKWKERGLPKKEYGRIADLFGWDLELLYKSQVHEKKRNKEVLTMPLMNVSAAMGSGALAPAYEEIISTITVNRRWAKDNLSITNPGNLRIIAGIGDSMKPTYQDGDILIVDIGVDKVNVDAVYVMERDNELFIKRIERKIDGSLMVISDNRERHDPYQIKKTDLDNVRICGRVVFVWNGKRL